MIDKLELLAVKSVALKDSEYFYRKVCRYYSEKFHTPLMEVYEIPWAFVFTNYLEHLIETNHNKESLYELVIDICYPEKRLDEEQEVEDWIKQIEAEEQAKRRAKQNPPNQEKKVETENPHIENGEIHMGEGVFSHLEEDMEQGVDDDK